MTTTAVDLWLIPLDRVRIRFYRALGTLARPLVRQRELRVAVLGSLLVVSSLAAAILLPVWLLALGPIVWGTPHLLSDVRYLVVRRGYHRRPGLWFAAGVPLALAAAGAGLLNGLLAAAGALLVARASRTRKVTALVVVGMLALGAHRLGGARDIVFAHAHNFIAVALWWTWRARTGRAHLAVPLLVLLASGWILLGDIDAFVIDHGITAFGPERFTFADLCWELAPGVRGPLAIRLVLLFAFAQAVHYAVWIRLIPEDDRPRATPRTFRATYRALELDFGRIALWLACACAFAFAAWAVVDLSVARHAYLRFALFHGHLELAALALWWAERKAPT